jgi:histidinol-phosphatase (PHP family)
MDRARIELYVESARANGVETIAITEHLFRFREAYDLLYGWWDDDPDGDPALAAAARAYWKDHVSGSVVEYAREIEAAKSAGLPVLLGLEMDWLPGHEEELRRFLAPYDWDIVLGSVHWIGAWGFDQGAPSPNWPEWERRDLDESFARYGGLLRELAASGLCDVLAHPDLPKLFGHRPSSFTPLHDAIIDAATDGPCAVEVNARGYRKKVAEPYPALSVLERAHAAGLAITLASDAHEPEEVGERFDDIASWAARAGYAEYVSYCARRASSHALQAEAG